MLSNFPLFDDQQLHNSFSLVVRTSVSNITWKSPPSLWLGGLCIKFWWVSHITYATYVATLAANPLVRIWFVSCSGWILQMISCWWGKTWPRELSFDSLHLQLLHSPPSLQSTLAINDLTYSNIILSQYSIHDQACLLALSDPSGYVCVCWFILLSLD